MSAYWIPTLFFQHRDGSVESVDGGDGMIAYYLPDSDARAFPDGLRILSNSAGRRSYDGWTAGSGTSFRCLDSPLGPETPGFPQRNCNQLRVQVTFPSCWDGQNLDSQDHQSHMAYKEGRRCPPSHPIKVIDLFYEVFFATGKFKDHWIDGHGKPTRAQPFFFSNGDNTGFGMHGDFMNGWKGDVLQKLMDDRSSCEGGVVQKCKFITMRTDERSCMPEYKPATDEQVEGKMPAPPGLDPIPVVPFNPCGKSPTSAFVSMSRRREPQNHLDQSRDGQPLGTCSGGLDGTLAYEWPQVTMDDPLVGTPVDVRLDTIEESDFRLVDGLNKDCRGAHANDNSNTYYEQFRVARLHECKKRCREHGACIGIEYENKNCEVWTRQAGIGATKPDDGAICLRYLHSGGKAPVPTQPPAPVTTRPSTKPPFGAACLTATGQRVDPLCVSSGFKWYSLEDGWHANLCNDNTCMLRCRPDGVAINSDFGESYGPGTLQDCMQASSPTTAFQPVDGGEGRACRGASPSDNDPSYYRLQSADTVSACESKCLEISECVGIEYNAKTKRCEVWTRPSGIRSSRAVAGFVCFRHAVSSWATTMTTTRTGSFQPVDGGESRACRGASPRDNDPSYYRLQSADTVSAWESKCLEISECVGIEYNARIKRCEVWIRPFGIQSSFAVTGFACFRYSASLLPRSVPAKAAALQEVPLHTRWLRQNFRGHGARALRPGGDQGNMLLQQLNTMTPMLHGEGPSATDEL
eukprot:TRINITY_DN14093_c0_g1_i1.p1 TRINITY_DN14093_c0_g1~~TRINITY_DN14093_c0_g1_i1.p1  ORF type:complete len:862 (-),score=116.59 TRINITY_DN14093_c0_g1_i1:110-2353(-)